MVARGPSQQADRARALDQREDREGAPDQRVPHDRRHRPHPGRALGRAARARWGRGTEVRLRRAGLDGTIGACDPPASGPSCAVACVALGSVALPVAAHADDGNDVDLRVERSCSLRSASSASARRTPVSCASRPRSARLAAGDDGASCSSTSGGSSCGRRGGRPELAVVLAQDDDPRLAGSGHRHRPGDRPARRDLPRLRDDPRELSTRRPRRRGAPPQATPSLPPRPRRIWLGGQTAWRAEQGEA